MNIYNRSVPFWFRHRSVHRHFVLQWLVMVISHGCRRLCSRSAEVAQMKHVLEAVTTWACNNICACWWWCAGHIGQATGQRESAWRVVIARRWRWRSVVLHANSWWVANSCSFVVVPPMVASVLLSDILRLWSHFSDQINSRCQDAVELKIWKVCWMLFFALQSSQYTRLSSVRRTWRMVCLRFSWPSACSLAGFSNTILPASLVWNTQDVNKRNCVAGLCLPGN